MEDKLQGLQDELATHLDYMNTIARATQRLTNAVGELMESLPPETRAELARRLAEEQGAEPPVD